MRVAVIGGGINGYCCAVRVLEHLKTMPNLKQSGDVTLISEVFSPHTTGDGSAGLWGPYLLGGTSADKIYKWSKGMHDFLEQIWRSEDAGEAGVCLIPVIRVTTNDQDMNSFWSDIVYGYRNCTENELKELSQTRQQKFTHGVHFVTYTSEPIKLLPYLMKRFQTNGGKVIQQKVENLFDFLKSNQYDIIINCTGLGSKAIIGDESMYPVRGQVARIKANWLYYVILDESDGGNYIIPNTDSVVLGGTQQVGDYNINVSSKDKKFIIDGCHILVPSLKHARYLFDWVGLRPGRHILRLEAEQIGNKLIIHNYGHGGSGVTLAWGCAEDVLELIEKNIRNQSVTKSKL